MKLKAALNIYACEGCVFEECKEIPCPYIKQTIQGVNFNCIDNDKIIYIEDKETVEVKLLTIKELREQFENEYEIIGEYDETDFCLNSKGEYEGRYMYIRWLGYYQCAKANGIIKEE